MADLYALSRTASDRIYTAPNIPAEALRERLATLNKLPITPERSRERAAIVRTLSGN